ncbi:MAG: hypothetical protein AAFR50_01550 [Pseudomonadota bacterium]
MSEKIEVENINTPGQTSRVDRTKYDDMRRALLRVLPTQTPGLTAAEAKAALIPHLDPALFPGGAKSGWWMKTVQLDLEAKGLVARSPTKPLRFYKM